MKRVLYRVSIKSVIILICLLGVSQSVLATTVVRPPDEDMLIGARAIVRGKVLSVGSAFDEHHNIYTYITIKVREVLKGQISERRIVIKEAGGQVGEQGSIVFGTPRFTRGEKVLLYLDTWKDGSLRVHQMFLGKFSIVQDERTGQEVAVRGEPDDHVDVLHSNSSARITDRMELSAYLDLVQSGLAANLERSRQFEETYYENAPLLAQPPEYRGLNDGGAIQPDFVLINSAHPRWFEPDTGQPVTFMVNPDGAPNGNAMADVTAAMNAWSNVPGCALQVVNGGSQAVCAPTFGLNTIIFNACDGRWSPAPGCAGILALGGLGWTGTTKVINGTTFHQATAGFVSINPNALCNFNDPCNVKETLTHEIGHALGLGHSQDGSATMAGIAHFDGRCASIRTDDVNGITFIYPTVGGGPGPLAVATSSLPNGTTGTAYNQPLIGSGGTQPYSWSLVQGQGALPPGLSLSAAGSISGAPTTAGTFNFTVRVTDNAAATAQKALGITVTTAGVALSSQFVSQTVPTSVQPFQSFSVNMKFLNTGTETWSGGAYYFASQNPPLNTTWGGNGVPLVAFSAAPGEIMDVTFTATAPATPGAYNFQWQMYQNGGLGFFGQVSTNVVIQVGSPTTPVDGAAFVSQSVPSSMTAGQSYSVSVTMSNAGTTTWIAGTYRLSSQNPLGNNTWGLNLVNLAASVAPNAQGVFSFNVTAPSTAGTYNFQWQMAGGGGSVFGAASSNVAVTVSSGGGSTPVKLTGIAFGTSPPWVAGREFDKSFDGNTNTIFDYAFDGGGYTGIDLGSAANARRIVKIRFFPRSDFSGGPGRMVGGRFQGSNTSSSSGYADLFTVSTAPGLNNWADVTVTDPAAYRYLRYVSPDGGYCNVGEVEFYTDTTAPPPPPPPDPGPQPIKVTGTPFGTGPAWVVGREFDKAFDSNTSTIFDYAFANGGYSGIDLGSTANARTIVKLRFFPRSDWSGGGTRMLGGKFQGSNTSNSSGFVDLYTVTTTPALGNWAEVTISDLTAYRYLRYLSPDGGWGNVAEVEFYTDSSAPPGPTPIKLAGTAFGTNPAWIPGREFDKAFDGNTTTIFDYALASGGYTGIDLGSTANARKIVKIRFFPRSDFGGGGVRMVGGRFQGSNSSSTSGFVDLHTVSTSPSLGAWTEVTISDATAYRYLRFLSPDGGFGNVAEIEFYTDQ